MVLKRTIYHVNKWNISHIFLKKKYKKKKTQTIFVSPPRKNDEKEKEKQEVGDELSICVRKLVTLPILIGINLVKVEI